MTIQCSHISWSYLIKDKEVVKIFRIVVQNEIANQLIFLKFYIPLSSMTIDSFEIFSVCVAKMQFSFWLKSY